MEPTRLAAEHGEFVTTSGCRAQAKNLRRRGAHDLLAAYPDLITWMAQPLADRRVQARRYNAWLFGRGVSPPAHSFPTWT